MAMLAIPRFTLENYAFISYIFVLNALLAVFASRRSSGLPLPQQVG
jgi:hypothetical protein